jgi:hypothetical protein
MLFQQTGLCSQLIAEAITRQPSPDLPERNGKPSVRHARA